MSLIAKHIKKTMTDGSTVEEYFWAGTLHRVDGPAMVRRNADGSWIEQYYRLGKLHREDGPAIICRKPDGSMSHAYYRDDERYQRLLGWAGTDSLFRTTSRVRNIEVGLKTGHVGAEKSRRHDLINSAPRGDYYAVCTYRST